MALFVYVTDKCREDAHRHTMLPAIERFSQRLLKEQRTNLFDNFPPPYMKKRFLRQIRLIAHQYPFGEHLVVCFLRLLVRGGSDYERFLDEPRTYGDRYLAPLVNMESLEKWLNERIQESPPPEKTEPSTEERRYLWDVVGTQSEQSTPVFVCESEDWVRAVADKRMRNRLVLLISPVLSASEEGATDKCQIPVEGRGDLILIGRLFPQHNKLFLAAALTSPSSQDIDQVHERYTELLSPDLDSVTEELILKHSMRAYPNELLLDEDLWFDVEKDEASNLALSPEETSILESVHNLKPCQDSVGFPLFINGRAGSGKSTILQYLFADYLRLFFSLPDSTSLLPPLYFTCSPDLLDRSRTVVSGLLTCGHRHVLRQDTQANIDKIRERIPPALSTCFREFHDFLYTLLPPQTKSESFPRTGYIDYARFKLLWGEKFGRDPKALKSYGPDLSWHVIRSYIKGLSADGYLEPEEYGEQPEGEQTISSETFQVIYDRVWNNWYKPLCEDGQYWDDQDLTRTLLDKDILRPEYPAIFCDEAQDFTRLELEAIFRLSLFSDRRLTPQELNRVPFAFAGDPFQTLNPTGFRWDAIKSAFVLKFLRSLDPACQSEIRDLNYHELSFNYRSTRNIVHLCNGIQALRSVLFDIPGVKPQMTWQHEQSSPMPVWFERGSAEVLDALKNQSDLTIIIPCQEGEEIEFVDNDEFLSSAVQRDDTGVPQNVLSAMRAKGLEFNRVVLYRFGDSCFQDLLSPICGGQAYASAPEKALPREYYLNRLYVAASRPKRRLFVIDTADGIRRLWRFATDQETQDALLNALRHDSDLWRKSIGMLQPGMPGSWSSDRESVKEIAERYEREGRATRDSYMLRSASMSFQSIGDHFKAGLCKAFALLYERKFTKAGDAFAECGDYQQALMAYWEGSQYKAILSLGETAPQVCSSIEHRIADFYECPVAINTTTDLVDLIEQRFADKDFLSQVLSSRAWEAAIVGVFERIAREGLPEAGAITWLAIANTAQRLSQLGVPIRKTNQGMLFYRADEWANAIAYWDSPNDTQTPEFRNAKSLVLISEIETGKRAEPSTDEARFLAEHYMKTKQCTLAVKYAARAKDEKGLSMALALACQLNDHTAAVDALEKAIDLFVSNARWSQLLELVIEGKWTLVPGEYKKTLHTLTEKAADRLLSTSALSLAQADLLPSADSSQQKRVSDFLKRTFIQQGVTWTKHTTPDVAGAAIERSGRVIDALQFYENVMDSSIFTDEQRHRARIRWLKSKFRQAERETQDNKTSSAERHNKEAASKSREWGINMPLDAPEYPSLKGLIEPIVKTSHTLATSVLIPSPLPPSEEIPQKIDSQEPKQEQPCPLPSYTEPQTTWTIGYLEFHYSRKAHRINIEHRITLETAAVRIVDRACKSADLDFIEEPQLIGVYTSARWNLQCDFREIDNSHVLTFRFLDKGIDLRLTIDAIAASTTDT